MTPHSIRDEFEKAFKEHFGFKPTSEDKQNEVIMQGQYDDWMLGAKWAAKWMANYLAQYYDDRAFTPKDFGTTIRQLAKGLDQ